MKKRITSFLIGLAMILAFSGCGAMTIGWFLMEMEESADSSEPESSKTAEPRNQEPVDEEPAQSFETPDSEPQNESKDKQSKEQQEFTIVAASGTKYAQLSLNVRDCPNASGARLGTLSVNQAVEITGQCKETGWYQINFNGQTGYASNAYLGDEQVQVPEPKPKQSVQTGGSGGGDTEQRIVDGSGLLALVNQDRAENNPSAGALVWDAALYAVAQQRIYRVYQNYVNQVWAHEGADGTYGENAAYVWTSANKAYGISYFNSGWINSADHHENRLSSHYTKYAAIGYYDGNGRTTFIELFR